MFIVAAMAVFIHDALGAGSVGFALAYSAFHLLLTWLWWRTGVHDSNHRPISQPFAAIFLITSLLFIVSVFVPAPWRFVLWGLALLVDLAQPLWTVMRIDASIRAELIRTYTVSPSAIERFGLFTIIVLGEVIVGTVSGLAGHHHLSWSVGITAALGMLIAVAIWWVYFDSVSRRPPMPSPLMNLGWMYLHLPIAIGIAAVGASILNVVEHAGEPLPDPVRWLLVGAVAAALIAIGLLMRILHLPEGYHSLYRIGSNLTLIASLLILLSGLTQMDTVPLLLTLNILLLAPVFYGILVWVKVFGGRELEI
jgi:low temperature requirement protein LtrA